MKKARLLHLILLISGVTFMTGCEKEITVNIPDAEAKLVVEGNIEPGYPPIIMLTTSVGYFDPTDINTLNNLFVHNAIVKVDNGSVEVQLDEICASSLPDSLIPLLTELTGITEEDLQYIDYCVYTSFDPAIWGEVGKTYDLTIDKDEHHVESSATIHDPIPLDSLWFEVWGSHDSLGYIWTNLTDPGGVNNNYRWLAKRINHYANGEQKDPAFVPPFNSTFDDQFFDGLSFEFAYDRGHALNSEKEDDNNIEEGFYKEGDTVVVKFCTIDRIPMQFYRAVETQEFSAGNPFAAPITIPSNIEGGLGVWVAYGVALDTVVCDPQ